MRSTCGILDYSVGNVGSVARALELAGGSPTIVQSAEQVRDVDVLVLPGVGAFGPAMRAMRERGVIEAVHDRASTDKPILGICLGMHLLFEGSAESPGDPGLGILPGFVQRLPNKSRIGWERIRPVDNSDSEDELLASTNGEHFFFCHNYFVPTSVPQCATMTCSGQEGTATVLRKNSILGVQFHPERSQGTGLRLLSKALSVWRTA